MKCDALLTWGSRLRVSTIVLGVLCFSPPTARAASLPVGPVEAVGDWAITAARPNQELGVVNDELLDTTVFEVEAGHQFTFVSPESEQDAYVVEALVRLTDENEVRGAGSARLEAGWRDSGNAFAYSLSVARVRRNARGVTMTPALGGHPKAALVAAIDSSAAGWGRGLNVSPRFNLSDISPLQTRHMREGLEADLPGIPEARNVWRSLRIEIRSGNVRMYQNGVLVIDDARRLNADGPFRLTLSGPARLAALASRTLAPMRDTGNYVTVPLDDLGNARGPVDTAAWRQRIGKDGRVADVPFRLVPATARGDHVDVAASQFRYRRETGYKPAAHPHNTYPAATQMDPARLMARVPARAYRRAWVLAAFDERPSHLPVLTLRFYRPREGWPIDSTVDVPAFSVRSADGNARRIEVPGRDGQPLSLWLLPIEIDAAALASDYREQDIFNIELTKAIYPHRAFPDPANYGYFQGGLPSGVRLYGLTLEEAPVHAFGRGRHNANLYTDPEEPLWFVELANQHERNVSAQVRLVVTGPEGRRWNYSQQATLTAAEQRTLRFALERDLYGLYAVQTEVTVGDWTQSREGAFLVMPPDNRRATGANTRFGLWNWMGTHGTNPDPDDNHRIMRALGVQTGSSQPWSERRNWGITPGAPRITGRGVPAWTLKEPVDPEELKAFRDRVEGVVRSILERDRDIQMFSSFPEHSISLRMTHGIPPETWGDPWWEPTDSEKARIRAHILMAETADDVVREVAPNKDFLFGWAAPGFIIPFLREGYDFSRYEGLGLDQPQFERMPERQPRSTEPSSLFLLQQELKKNNLDLPIMHVESYFHSSHELALGHRGQADNTVRTAVLSLAWGTTRFIKSWSLHDCSAAWGSQHYGCVGLISRRPEYNPKPAAAAFATMTRVLDLAEYDTWLDIGSRSAYLLAFKDRDRRVYPAWTIRGTRPLTVTLDSANAQVEVVDENGNSRVAELNPEFQATVTLSQTPLWLVVREGEIVSGVVGDPQYDAAPAEHHRVLDRLAGNWRYNPDPLPGYAENHWDIIRKPGPMALEFVAAEERDDATVMQVALTETVTNAPLLALYGGFEPQQPIELPGRPRAIGVWGKGASAWNRVVFELEDAEGEIFRNTGSRNAWNCDDTHSWSFFNFDGWRYMEFPLPASAPGDDYREMDSVWWGSTGDGIVDLPLKLRRVIVEMRSHMVYADAMVPVDSLVVQMADLTAVYDDAVSMTEAPVKVQRQARKDLQVRIDPANQPNPIRDMQATGVGAATRIQRLYQPKDYRSGNEVNLSIAGVDGATAYQVWLSAYPDGRGAVEVKTRPVSPDSPTEVQVRGLQPSIPLYFFVTYTDADGKQSKPSPGRKTVLKDEFPMK